MVTDEKVKDEGPLEWGPGSSESFSTMLESGVRMLASLLGIVIIIVGLFLTLKTFSLLYDGLTDPNGFAPILQQLRDAIGGDKAKIQVNGQELQLAPMLAVFTLGTGMFVLTWLSLGVMLTGAKIISWMSGEREAIKRILRHSLGPGRSRPGAL